MLKKVLLAAVVAHSVTYADTSYTKYFYGKPKQSVVKKRAYPVQRRSAPRRMPIKPYRQPQQGLYVEGHIAGRIPWPFSISPFSAKSSSKTSSRRSSTPMTPDPAFTLPFSISSKGRIGYDDTLKEKEKKFRVLPTPISEKVLFPGLVIGGRLHEYFALEASIPFLLPAQSARYQFILGAIPSFTAKFIGTFQKTEIYLKGGLAFPMGLLRETKAVRETKENKTGKIEGPWTISCYPHLLLSIGGSHPLPGLPAIRGQLSLNSLVHTSSEKNKRRLSGNGFPKSPQQNITATWLQAGVSYRIL